MSGYEKIGQILSSSIPRDFLLSLQQLVPPALSKALAVGMMAHEDHRPTLCGQARHLFLNEALKAAFEECAIPHPKLRGNTVMMGKVGITTLARVHMNQCKWDNSRRSKKKRELCHPNYQAKIMVQSDLFAGEQEVAEVTVFVVTEGVGSDGHNPIFLVVPDENMDLRNPVFKEELQTFLQRYQKAEDIVDIAKPKLKPGIQRSDKSEASDET